MHLTDAHDGIPPIAFPIAGLVIVAAVGVFIAALAIRNVPTFVDCCPHPDLDDFPEETSRG